MLATEIGKKVRIYYLHRLGFCLAFLITFFIARSRRVNTYLLWQ